MKSPMVLVLSLALLAGSLPAAAAPDPGAVRAGAPARRAQRVVLQVTAKGWEPSVVHLKAGVPTVLVVTRRTDKTCVLDFVLKDRRIKQPLPLDRPVEIRLPAEKPGRLRFACGMDMYSGTLVIQ